MFQATIRNLSLSSSSVWIAVVGWGDSWMKRSSYPSLNPQGSCQLCWVADKMPLLPDSHYDCVCVWMQVCLSRSEDNFEKWVLSLPDGFHGLNLGHWACTHPLSHLTGPHTELFIKLLQGAHISYNFPVPEFKVLSKGFSLDGKLVTCLPFSCCWSTPSFLVTA